MSCICGFIDLHKKISSDDKDRIISRMSRNVKHRCHQMPFTYITPDIALYVCSDDVNSAMSYKQNIFSARDRYLTFLDGVLFNNNRSSQLENSLFISKLYEKYKQKYVEHLDGEFVCFIWDNKEKKVLLSKDLVGSKPVYYYTSFEYFIFASEVKSILATQLFVPEINLAAVNDYLSYGYVPHPETMFKNIFQVEPGTTIELQGSRIKKDVYWMFDFEEVDQPEEYYINNLNELLLNSITKRVKNNRNVSAYLSGGIDSSSICSLLSKMKDISFKAITIGFENENFNEIPFAKLVAEKYNINWISKVIQPNQILPLFEKITYLHDSPFKDSSAFPSYYAAKTASEYSNTVLTGDGPDQFMLGSDHHKDLLEVVLRDNLPKKLLRKSGIRKLFELLPISAPTECLFHKAKRRIYSESIPFSEKVYQGNVFPLLLKRYLYTPEFLKVNNEFNLFRNIVPSMKRVENRQILEQYLYFDIYFYLHDDLLPKVERTCRANKVQPLFPFLDKDLLLFMQKIPLKYRMNGFETKYIMKKAFSNLLPPELISKKKMGFAIPIDQWYKSDLKKYILEILLDEKSLNRGYFRKKRLRNMIERYFAGETSYYTGSSTLINTLLTLELWHRIFFDQKRYLNAL